MLTRQSFLRQIICRTISKTNTATNSDALTAPAHRQLKNPPKSIPNKWIRMNRHSNNRALSTLQSKITPRITTPLPLISKDEQRELMAVFPDLVRDLTEAGRQTEIPTIMKRFAKTLHYNVPNGKKTRATIVIAAYKSLEKEENLTPENLRLAMILGWCLEMMHNFTLMLDDIQDASEIRHGVPCWYRLPEIGLSAINDSILVKEGIFTLLQRHLRNHPQYTTILELFHKCIRITTMGQGLDMESVLNGRPQFDIYTMARYNLICKYKTSFYSFYMPMALGMYLANLDDPEMHRQANTVLTEMGHFFQVQDDFLDCFVDSSLTGKIGSDILEGKCTWFAVLALQRCTPEQRKIFEKYYGNRDEPDTVNVIRSLYEELGLPNTFAIYEEENYNIIRTHIQQLTKGLPQQIFFQLLDRIYRRSS